MGKYNSSLGHNAINSGEFLDAAVVQDALAAHTARQAARIKLLETELARAAERCHNVYHIGIIRRHGSWEDCGMSSCRMARAILNEEWDKEE